MRRRSIKVMFNGVSFMPMDRDRHYCKVMFGAGQVLMIDPEEERDMNSHRHYFVQLSEAWRSLPESFDPQYPTLEIFRKKLLVRAGWYHMTEMVCASAESAITTAAFMSDIDPSVLIDIRGNVIRKYVARSQSLAAMGRKDFQKSKWDVLNLAAALIRVTPKQLEEHARRAEYDEEISP